MLYERIDQLDPEQGPIGRMAALVARADMPGVRDELVALLMRPWSAAWLRALDDAGLLTQIIFELEPARDVDQPIVHFLPVLEHSLETVCAVDWLLRELGVARADLQPRYDLPPPAACSAERAVPVAVQTHSELRYRSVYAAEFRAHRSEERRVGKAGRWR